MHAEDEQIDFVGAVKLMDGVFLGDAICSDVINLIYFLKDYEFLHCNKILNVINCASDYIDNNFTDKGIKYLSLSWHEYQVLYSHYFK